MASSRLSIGGFMLVFSLLVAGPAQQTLGAGACCFAEFQSCTTDLTQGECEMGGGDFLGEDTDCDACGFGLEDLNDTSDDDINSEQVGDDNDDNNDGTGDPSDDDLDLDELGPLGLLIFALDNPCQTCGADCGLCGLGMMSLTMVGIGAMGRVRRLRRRR